MELTEVLQLALEKGASDVHLKAGVPPVIRVHNKLFPLKEIKRLTSDETAAMLLGILTTGQKERFERIGEIDFGYGIPGLGRFRVNLFHQRATIAAVIRAIPVKILTIRELSLPPVIESLALEERGLILVTGATGSGKSTTLAAMIDYINTRETNNIITIEDPIEFLVRDKSSIVSQREVGTDTPSFHQALKSALRQDPDIILVGEMRDVETIETALIAASTGHLVMSTLHTTDAAETVNRIVSMFDANHQQQIRLQLSSVLRAIVSQRLVSKADGTGRVPAVEVLRTTARIRELIENKDRTREITEAIAEGNVSYGMQTFDQSLMGLLSSGLINHAEAVRNASNPDDFALRIQGVSSGTDSRWEQFEERGVNDPAPPARPEPRVRAVSPHAPPAAPPQKPGNESEFELERF